ncbi:glutaredoxin family protein [Gilvimarinus algae]|uniref:Glutaredoxin family protein n=1 Tax=Gilvimarinus algae TaxID=3058037 RepID=A0ABT8TBS1_9GAMM|nr:glutaredoxin family protein [Gilvimarinus sp. SDUM040014]MDO3381542.1 glutaredoxin family protein [Gilvimarinus sp. SDUM040014]
MKAALFLLIAFAVVIKLGFIDNPFAPAPELVDGYQDGVVLYATAWCGYCKKTRELLRQKGIPYTEYDIEKSSKGKRDYEQLNGRGVPLLVINGEVVRGYNPNAILALASR